MNSGFKITKNSPLFSTFPHNFSKKAKKSAFFWIFKKENTILLRFFSWMWRTKNEEYDFSCVAVRVGATNFFQFRCHEMKSICDKKRVVFPNCLQMPILRFVYKNRVVLWAHVFDRVDCCPTRAEITALWRCFVLYCCSASYRCVVWLFTALGLRKIYVSGRKRPSFAP